MAPLRAQLTADAAAAVDAAKARQRRAAEAAPLLAPLAGVRKRRGPNRTYPLLRDADPDDYVRFADIAAAIGITYQSLSKRADRRDVPRYWIGKDYKTVWVHSADVERLASA